MADRSSSIRATMWAVMAALTAWSVGGEIFYIGFLPLRGKGYESKHAVGAFIKALLDVNATFKDTGHGLDYKHTDPDVNADTLEAVRRMTAMHDQVVAFIGPEDTCATEAKIASAWNKPMIGYKCGDSRMSNKTLYPTFARTAPPTSKFAKYVLSLMKHFGWRHCSLVVEEKVNWIEASETIQRLASGYEVQIMHVKLFGEDPVDKTNVMVNILDQTDSSTRIYVFLGDDFALIDFMRAMHMEGLNNGHYSVIGVLDKPYDPEAKLKYFNKFLENATTLRTLAHFRPLLMLRPSQPINKDYDKFLQATRDYSIKYFGAPDMSALKLHVKVEVPVPIYAAYLYDAVYVYARALNWTLAHGEDPRNGTAVMKHIFNKHYHSIQGYNMYIDENGDAEANYTVLALKYDVREPRFHKSLLPVGHFTMRHPGIPKYNPDAPIDWLKGRPPRSEPECGFDGSLCQFNDWKTVVICIVFAFVIMILTAFACKTYIYEQKLARLLWKIEFRELLLAEAEMDPTMSEKTKRKIVGRLSYLSSEDSREDSKTGRPTFTKVASYKGSLVAVRMLKRRHVEITRAVRKELQQLKEMSHDNINRFIGACVEPPHVCIVTHYCARGSLKDILENDDIHLDNMFIGSLVFDLIKGMIYLHEGEIGCHGNLKSSNCLVDSRWVLQIADFGLHHFKQAEIPQIVDEETYYKRLLWKAPELLRDPYAPARGSQKGDVYSFAIILYEIHGRCGPWGPTVYTAREIVDSLKKPAGDWILRPDTCLLKCDEFIVKCIQECWQEDPDGRPDFKYIRIRLKPMQRGLRSHIIDNMLAIMEKYANNLEAVVAERTEQLLEEKKKTEVLLLRMLPKFVAEQLKLGHPVVPEQYERVTIYFSDIVGFTGISAESTPMQVVDMLNDLYTCFDSIIGEYDVYKVETIGDAYMVVSGLPIRNGDNHAGEIASMSLHLLTAIHNFKIRHRPQEKLNLRIGIHSGPCVAAVVGLKMPRYCLFGDTVNTASRMESNGLPLKIHCSSQCREILDKLGGYQLDERGYISIKGKGEVFTYFLTGEDKSQRLRRISIPVAAEKETPQPLPAVNIRHQRRPLVRTQRSSATNSSLSSSDDSLDSTVAPHTNLINNNNVNILNNVNMFMNGHARFPREKSAPAELARL